MFPLPDPIGQICEGALLAGLIRWVFRLDVDLRLAVGIGVLSRFFGAWALEHLVAPMSTYSLSTILMTVSATTALLGVAQLTRGH